MPSMLILFLSLFFAQPVFAKYKVCTMTISSPDESEVFKDKLSNSDFEFQELLDFAQGQGDNDWFKKACQSGVRCDVLLISGHFGGSFFGTNSKGVGLSTDELETRACSGDCAGILNNPSEVFLMGCNTLAGKQQDHRTPEQYLQVLLDDGIPRATAERVVAARYSALGDSYKERMQRVFMGIPRLYGFSSVGPSGKTVRPYINQYFDQVGDYKKHLAKMQATRISNSIANINDKLKEYSNQVLASVLSLTAFDQCSGIDKDSPLAETQKKVCALSDESVPLADRVRKATELLKEDPFKFMPSVQAFVNNKSSNIANDPEASKALTEMKSDQGVKDKIAEMESLLKNSPTMMVDLLTFQKNLEWISDEDFKQKAIEIAKPLLKNLTQEHVQFICNNSHHFQIETKFEDFNPQQIAEIDTMGIHACTTTKDQRISQKVLEKAEEMRKQGHQFAGQMLGIVSNMPGYDKEKLALARHFKNSGDEWVRVAANSIILEQGNDQERLDAFKFMLKDPAMGLWRLQSAIQEKKVKITDTMWDLAMGEARQELANQQNAIGQPNQPHPQSYYRSLMYSITPNENTGKWEQLIKEFPDDWNQHSAHWFNRAIALESVNQPIVNQAIKIIKEGDLDQGGYVGSVAYVLKESKLSDSQISQLGDQLIAIVDQEKAQMARDGLTWSGGRSRKASAIRMILKGKSYGSLPANFKSYVDEGFVAEYSCQVRRDARGNMQGATCQGNL